MRWTSHGSRRSATKARPATKPAKFRPRLLTLEDRVTPTQCIFVDFGDNFPVSGTNRVLTTTVGAVRDVATAQRDNNNNPIPFTVVQGPQLKDASKNNYSDATAVSLTRFNYTAGQRAQIMQMVRRAFAAVNVRVVELTPTVQTVPDGRTVVGAGNLADVVAAMRGNNTGSSDVYIVAATPAIGPSNDNPNTFATNAYGGISPTGTVLGEQADLQSSVNNHDDLALAFVNSNLNFVANTIVHEAGHCMGLQHAVTNAAPAGTAVNNLIHTSEVMSYLSGGGGATPEFFFTRFPMVRGDDNTPSSGSTPFNNNDLEARDNPNTNDNDPNTTEDVETTPFDQLRVDPNVGENPALHFISGTAAHDIITISENNLANSGLTVTVRAFSDAAHTTAITVPGTTGTTYTYHIAPDRALLIEAGPGDDVINLETGGTVTIRGGSGNDVFNLKTGGRTLSVAGEDGDDTINVEYLARGMDSVIFDGGTGRDQFRFSPTLGSLNNVLSPVQINDPLNLGREDELWLNDSRADNNNRTYRVSASTIQTPGNLSTITYANVGRILVSAGSGNGTTANVVGTAAGTNTVIENAPNVNVGGPSPNPAIAGTFTEPVHGSLEIRNTTTRPTDLTITDTGNGRRRDITLESRRVLGLTDQPIVFNNILDGSSTTLSSLTVNAGSGGNTVVVGNTLSPARVGSITLNTGTGDDTVRVERTDTSVTVNGQNGADTVLVGLDGSVRGVTAPLTVTNGRAWSALTLDDSADPDRRDATLSRVGTYAEVTGLAPATIRVRQQDLRAFTILGGPRDNAFTVRDTPLSTIPGGMTTTLLCGPGNNVVTLTGTTGPIAVDGQGGVNQTVVGGSPTGLNRINGAVTVSGAGGSNHLTVDDFAATTGHAYVLDRNVVQRTDRAAIFFQDLSSLSFTAGASAETDTISVRDTAPNILTDVSYGGGNDVMTVERTAPGLVILRAGASTQIDVGTGTSSPNNIRGLVRVVCEPDNLVTLRLNDTATTTPRDLNVSVTDLGQRYQRAAGGSGDWQTLVEVFFTPLFGAPVEYFEYLGGPGGSTVFVDSTPAGTTSSFYGQAGAHDEFRLGWAANMNQILGQVNVAGQAADLDYAVYYDYLNPNPQTYDVGALFSTMYIRRPGAGVAAFNGLVQVVFYAPRGGGSVENVRYVTPGTFLNMAVGGDVVTVGTSAPNLGGSLAGIQGPISVGGYVDANVRLIVDNSGNPTTGYQGVSLSRRQGPYDYGSHIVGFAPATIYWNFGGASTVDLRGGAADEFFSVANGLPDQISIDGGGGSNLLQSEGGVPARFTFTGHNAGRLYDNVHFSAIQTFYGTDADDQFDFRSGATIDGGIDGFGGTNTVDYSDTQGAAGQVSRYRADGNALDAVGNNPGVLVNGTYGPGRFGQAFQFSGYDNPGYVQVRDAPGLEPATVSVEAWVNSTYLTAPGAYGYIVSKGAADYRGASYALVTSNHSGLWFYIGNGSAFQYSPDPGSAIWDGNWHHVIGTYDGSYVRLYVDGVEVGNGARLDNALGFGLPNTNDLFIGTYNGLPGYTFNGRIDEVSVFNRALSAAEVRARFDAAVAGEPTSGPGVYVNLQTGQATGVAGAITHIQNAIGSAGDDILVSNGGNALFGRAGRDLLIAGASASQLFGGGGEDILIGGTTAYDTDRDGLNRIMAVWTSAADYDTRTHDLRFGLLNADSVSGNGQQNGLYGEAGRDFFLETLADLDDANDDPNDGVEVVVGI